MAGFERAAVPTKVCLLGDSITQGLGSKSINFTAELSKILGGGGMKLSIWHVQVQRSTMLSHYLMMEK